MAPTQSIRTRWKRQTHDNGSWKTMRFRGRRRRKVRKNLGISPAAFVSIFSPYGFGRSWRERQCRSSSKCLLLPSLTLTVRPSVYLSRSGRPQNLSFLPSSSTALPSLMPSCFKGDLIERTLLERLRDLQVDARRHDRTIAVVSGFMRTMIQKDSFCLC